MPRKQHQYHYIYRTTCSVTGKYYIGMHSTSNLEDGYFGSGKVLRRSLNKYGKENHSIEILEWLPDRSSLKSREKEIVNEELLVVPMCMNLQLGGGGGFGGELHKLALKSAAYSALIRNWKNPEVSERMNRHKPETFRKTHASGKIKYGMFKGRTHTMETKDKIGSINSIKQKGQRNSQYGTCWITNVESNKSIKIKNRNSIFT